MQFDLIDAAARPIPSGPAGAGPDRRRTAVAPGIRRTHMFLCKSSFAEIRKQKYDRNVHDDCNVTTKKAEEQA